MRPTHWGEKCALRVQASTQTQTQTALRTNVLDYSAVSPRGAASPDRSFRFLAWHSSRASR